MKLKRNIIQICKAIVLAGILSMVSTSNMYASEVEYQEVASEVIMNSLKIYLVKVKFNIHPYSGCFPYIAN